MTLNEISTKLNSYAYECGGNHHTPQEIQETLLELADEIYKIKENMLVFTEKMNVYIEKDKFPFE